MTRQTLGYPAPHLHLAGDLARRARPAAKCVGPLPGDVSLPGGPFLLGADRGEPFVFDNEKWAHPVTVAPFRISATPVTNAEFEAFVADGGYRRRECWGRRGWDWRRREGVEHPLFWQRAGTDWFERRFDVLVPLQAWHPVVHVNWWMCLEGISAKPPGPMVVAFPESFISTFALPLTIITCSVGVCQCQGMTQPAEALNRITDGPLAGSPLCTAMFTQDGSGG